MYGQGALDLYNRGHRLSGAWKGYKKGVSLGIDHAAIPFLKDRTFKGFWFILYHLLLAEADFFELISDGEGGEVWSLCAVQPCSSKQDNKAMLDQHCIDCRKLLYTESAWIEIGCNH
jgi:hypothetical protein